MTQREAHTEIMRRLRARHHGEVWDGEVMVPDRSSQRMDFLAMACSWSRPNVVAYEVKVSRQDFVRDDKWTAYLPACNQLIFVTAPGVATLGEIPEECGWQELSKNGALLITRKKAPRRPMDPATEARLYKGMLMRVGKPPVRSQDQWHEWLQQKREDRRLGQVVGAEIKQTLRERVDNVAKENAKLLADNTRLEWVRDELAKLGLPANTGAVGQRWGLERVIREAVRAANGGDVVTESDDIARALLSLASTLTSQAEKLKGFGTTVKRRVQEHEAETRPPAVS